MHCRTITALPGHCWTPDTMLHVGNNETKCLVAAADKICDTRAAAGTMGLLFVINFICDLKLYFGIINQFLLLQHNCSNAVIS